MGVWLSWESVAFASRRSGVRIPPSPPPNHKVLTAKRAGLFYLWRWGDSKRSERRQWRKSGQDVRVSERQGSLRRSTHDVCDVVGESPHLHHHEIIDIIILIRNISRCFDWDYRISPLILHPHSPSHFHQSFLGYPAGSFYAFHQNIPDIFRILLQQLSFLSQRAQVFIEGFSKNYLQP